MKKFLVILLIFPVALFAQRPNCTSCIVYKHFSDHGGENLYVWVPADTTHRQKVFDFKPGDGESNGDTSAISTNGPFQFIKFSGWRPSFYVVCMQFTSAPAPPSDYYKMIDTLKADFNIDTTQWVVSGLSYGGQETWAQQEDSVTLHAHFRMSASAIMSYEHTICTNCGDQYYPYSKLPIWGFGSLSDAHGVGEYNYFADVLWPDYHQTPKLFTTYIGGHCCWNQFYDPTFSDTTTGAGGMNIYDWAFQFSINAGPTANAGADQTVVITNSAGLNPTSQILLDGSGSTHGSGGPIVSWAWATVSHPGGAADTIYKATSMQAVAANFTVVGPYKYVLTVTDSSANVSIDTVIMTCTATPTVPFPVAGLLIQDIVQNEYSTYYKLSDGNVYQRQFDGTGATMRPFLNYIGKPLQMQGDQYYGVGCDNLGFAYILGHNSYYNVPQFIPVDTLGHLFDSVFYAVGGLPFTQFFLRGAGKLYVMGTDRLLWYGILGTPIGRPLAVAMPSGKLFRKIRLSEYGLLALATDSTVWLAGPCGTAGCGVTWVQQNIASFGIGKAIDIETNRKGSMCALIPDVGHPLTAGQPYCWGYVQYVGGTTGGSTPADYRSILQIHGSSHYPVKSMGSSDESFSFLDTTGHEWSVGWNGMGEVGNGYELVNHAEIFGQQTWPPAWYLYASDWLTGPFVTPAVDITPAGHTIVQIFHGGPFSFGKQRLDERDSLWVNGRDKSYELDRRAMADGGLTYPNGLDLISPTQVTPIYGAIDQRTMVIMTATAGNDTSVAATTVTLHGHTAATTFYTQDSVYWHQLSGPNTPAKTRNDSVLTLTGLTTGTYVEVLRMVDNNTGSIEDTLHLTVTPSTPPIVSAGGPYTITLPVTTVTLAGTATPVSPATAITVYAWTFVSGPATPTITTPATATTNATGLTTAGTYVFKLTVTDNNGNTNFATAIVTVTPSGCTNCLTSPIPINVAI